MKARAYLLISPLILVAGMHFIIWIQKNGGFSKKFYARITSMRGNFGSTDTSSSRVWDAAEKTFVERE